MSQRNWLITVVLLVAIAATVVAVFLAQNDDPLALVTTTVAGPAATTTTVAPVTTTSTPPTTSTTVPPTTTTSTTVPAVPELVTVRADGVYLRDELVASGSVANAHAWADGQVVFQPDGGAITFRSPDGAISEFPVDADVTLAGAGAIDGRRVMLYAVWIPARVEGVDIMEGHLWWYDLASSDAAEISVIASYESGWTSLAVAPHVIGVGRLGEGSVWLELFRLDGTVVEHGLAQELWFDEFWTPWLSPDGSQVVSISDGRLTLWELSSGAEVSSVDVPLATESAGIVGFDGQIVYVTYEEGGVDVTIAVDLADGAITELGSGVSRPLLNG